MSYPAVQLLIANQWVDGSGGESLPVLNPATGEEIGRVAKASRADLDAAISGAQSGFIAWKATSAFERYRILRKAAEIIRGRTAEMAQLMTLEQGKPIAQSKAECDNAGDLIDWFAEEGRRVYGRHIPSRHPAVEQHALREPIGPVAAFTPWNFPVNQAVRKIAAALAAGCSIVLKGPEETPASCAELVRAFVDAGLPPGALSLVYGAPSEISSYLIPHPAIRKVSFTGSTVVGKHLASLAGAHMKPVTMELGGHSPVVVFDDADIGRALSILSPAKFRNAGQVCTSPTRFLVHEKIYGDFVDGFVEAARKTVVGDGLDPATTMGPLANDRRVAAMESLVSDAVQHGAKIALGGSRLGNRGNFFEPTILTDVPHQARLMNEEPFGPVVPISRFASFDEAVAEANRLDYGLAAYGYTGSDRTARDFAARVETGMISINHHGLGLPEVPFGGIKDSGYGTEGGADALDAYLVTKFVTLHRSAA